MTPVSLGKVTVAAAGTRVQLGATTLSAAALSTDTTLTVASAAGFSSDMCPFPALVETEVVRVTAIAGTSFSVVRGQSGSIPSAHSAGVAVAAQLQFSVLFATVIAGLTGKCYLGTKSLNAVSFAGTIKQFWPNAAGGVDDNFTMESATGENIFSLNSYWVDAAVSGEGLIISLWIA